MTEVGIELLGCLRALSEAARGLEREIRDPLPEPSQRLGNLEAAVAGLGQAKPTKSLRCPEQYVKRWNEFLENEQCPLEPRAVRYLCWQPEIATSQPFQYYLDHDDVHLNARYLQGLVRSCHVRWSVEFAKSQVVTRVRDRLETYKGANRLLSRWKENSALILGPKGAEEFGAEMIEKLEGIKPHCESWGIADETSAYVQAAVRHAAGICRDQMDRVPEIRQYLLAELLLWTGWAPDVFKQEVSKVVLHPASTQVADVKESVTHFVLNDSRLGDPRLPRNRLNWVGIGEAERRVIEWLSQLDIVFFFESVLPRGKDPHGRKDFWLRYVSRVARSRPLLSWNDRYRLEGILKQKGQELAHFGSVSGFTSAFLLDFGPVLAVEFSVVGNACYLYNKNEIAKIVPDFWTPKSFDLAELKQQELCLKRIIHKTRKSAWHTGWQEEAQQTLATFGIRPGDRR